LFFKLVNYLLRHLCSLAARPGRPECLMAGSWATSSCAATTRPSPNSSGGTALVLAVWRCLLANAHDGGNAFQASFLLLARKAATIRRPDSVASWLHGVAHRLAQDARDGARSRPLAQHPEVGVRTAESVTAFVDDADHFRNAEAVGRYFGLVPC
jgi:hypothetical protein